MKQLLIKLGFWKKKSNSQTKEEIKIEEKFTFRERVVRNHLYKTIDKLTAKCKIRVEERDGITFTYWQDHYGNDIKLERSDGNGYMQLVNEYGEVFGAVLINKDREDEAMIVQSSLPFDVNMKWCLANN